MEALSEVTKLTRIKTLVAAGTSDINSDSVDMTGFDCVLFIVEFGAIVAAAVTSIKAQQSSDDGVGDAFADLAGTAVTVADSDDDKVFYLDIHNPDERYLRAVVDRGTQNATIDSIIAIQYRKRGAVPTVNGATVGGGELHISPTTGTP